jgi:hypothetical protein
MHILTKAAVTAAASTGLCLAIALPASASTPTFPVTLQQGQAPTTATEFGGHDTDCGNAANQDGWYFVLPTTDTAFQTLTLNFTGGTEIGTPNFIQSGKKALVETTPGATLTSGSATVTTTSGEAPNQDFFTLSHTCAATSTSPGPSSSSTAPTSSGTTSGGSSSKGASSSAPGAFPSGGVQTGGGKPAPGSLWIPAGLGLSGVALVSFLIGLARRRLARR